MSAYKIHEFLLKRLNSGYFENIRMFAPTGLPFSHDNSWLEFDGSSYLDRRYALRSAVVATVTCHSISFSYAISLGLEVFEFPTSAAESEKELLGKILLVLRSLMML